MTSSARPDSRDEREPLLQSSETSPSLSPRTENAQGFQYRINTFIASQDARTVSSVFLLQLLVSFAKQVIEVPTVAILEGAICTRYYRSHNISQSPFNQSMCSNIPQVQDQLSRLTGWKFFFDNLPGLLTAIYFGELSDRFGRRPILSLFCVGTLCSYVWIVAVCYANAMFPPQLIWASSVFILVGAGGQRVCKAMQFTIMADTFEQPRRTKYMSLLASIPHISKLVAPPIAGLLMNVADWIPFAMAIGFLMLGVPVIWMMQDSSSRGRREALPSDDAAESPLLSNHPGLGPSTMPADALSSSGNERPAALPAKRSVFRDLRHLLSTPTVPFCFALLLLRPFALISRAFIYQHASETFDWSMSRTTWLRVAQAAGSSTVTLILLPLLSTYLIHRYHRKLSGANDDDLTLPIPEPPTNTTHNHYSKTRDLNTIRASLFIATLGFFLLWRATANYQLILGLVICGLSEGLDPGLQALATTLVHNKAYNARLLTFVAVLEISGKLAGGPIMGWLFGIGRGEEHGSSGLNFAVSAGMFLVLGLGSLTVRLEK